VGGGGGGGGESNATLKPAKPSLIEVVLFSPLLSIIKNSCGVHPIIYLFIILYVYL
jgi:hypothetical protein